MRQDIKFRQLVDAAEERQVRRLAEVLERRDQQARGPGEGRGSGEAQGSGEALGSGEARGSGATAREPVVPECPAPWLGVDVVIGYPVIHR